jgi:hypothetical protein
MLAYKADTAFEQACIAYENHGLGAPQLDVKERGDALAALDILRPFDVSLLEAARYYAGHHESITSSKSVKDAVAALVKAKEQDGLSRRSTKDLRNRLDRFANKFGERKISELSVLDIENWLRDRRARPPRAATWQSGRRSRPGLSPIRDATPVRCVRRICASYWKLIDRGLAL